MRPVGSGPSRLGLYGAALSGLHAVPRAAGSYTPFALGALHGAWGWTLFGLVCALAAAGIVLKTTQRLAHPWASTSLYLAMGWLVLIAAVPLLERVPAKSIVWLVAGGLAYTLGVEFFVLDARVKYAHALWHLLVVVGTGCHTVALLALTGMPCAQYRQTPLWGLFRYW